MSFPTNPQAGQTYTDASGVQWVFNAQGAWRVVILSGSTGSPQEMLVGVGAPANTLGIDTDYYVDIATGLLWGPRAGGAWPGVAGSSLFSPNGLLTGLGGPGSSVGANGNYYLSLDTGAFYGPKAGGTWPPTIANLFSPAQFLVGSGVPSSSTGFNGNYYLDLATGLIYGPKAAGAWTTGANIFAPTALLVGTGAPAPGLGLNANYYLDQASGLLYGPKAAGVWPSGVQLIPDANIIAGNSAGAVPSNAIGRNTDYFLDTSTNFVYGPKAANAWPGTPIASTGRVVVSDTNYTVLAGNKIIAYTAITASRTVTLPLAVSTPAGFMVTIIDESGACSAVNTLVVSASGGNTINGGASASLGYAYAAGRFESNGSNAWTLVDQAQDQSLFRGSLSGLTLSNDGTTPNTIIDVSVGVACSDDGAFMMKLPTAWTKSIGATFALGSGAGGLDAGSAVLSTWYHVFLIGNPLTGASDILLSTNVSAPIMPTGFTKKRRIGSIKTDASIHILAFTQNNDQFLWAVMVADLGFSVTQTPTLLSLPSIPLGVKINLLMSIDIVNNAGSTSVLVNSPDQVAINGASLVSGQITVTSPSINSHSSMQVNIQTNAAAQVRVVSSINAGNALVGYVYGWIDLRGKNA